MKQKLWGLFLTLSLLLSMTIFPAKAAEIKIIGGDSMENATEIDFDTEYYSNFENKNDISWFQFTTPTEGYCNIWSHDSQNVGLCLELSTVSGKILAEHGSILDTNKLNLKLEANQTYYIKTRATNEKKLPGNANFMVIFKEDKVGDSFDDAQPIEVNQYYHSEINGMKDSDFFIFYGEKDKEYSFEFCNISGSNLGKRFILYDENKNEIKRTTISGKVLTTDFDTYYVKIVPTSTIGTVDFAEKHEYSITVTCETPSQPVISVVTPQEPEDSYEPIDEQEEDICYHYDTQQTQYRTNIDPYDTEKHRITKVFKETCTNCGILIADNIVQEEYHPHNFSNNKCTECDFEYIPDFETYEVPPFSDIPDTFKNEHCRKALKALYDEGVISGYAIDNTFRPYENLTRAEAASLLFFLYDYREPYSEYTQYSDVPYSHWASGMIQAMSDKGYLHGVGNNRFNPDEQLTGYQMLVLAVNAAGLENQAISHGGFPHGFLTTAKNRGLLQGIDNYDSINWYAPIQRYQAAVLLYNGWHYWLVTPTI